MKSRSVSFMLAICKWCALMLFQGLWCAVDFEEERWRLYELVLFPSLPGLPACTASGGILVQCSSWQLTDCPVEPSFCVFICHKVTLDLQMLGLPPAPSPTPQEKERKKKKMKEGKLPDGSSDSTLIARSCNCPSSFPRWSFFPPRLLN